MSQNLSNISEFYMAPASPFTSHFTAHTGEYVAWFHFGSAYNYADRFWKSFLKIMRIWSKPLADKLPEKAIPDTPQELHKTFFLMEQASQRCGKAILVFDRVDLLGGGSVKKFIWNLACAEISGVTIVMTDQEHVDVGRMEHVRASRLTNRTLLFNREELRIYYTALGIILSSDMMQKVWDITGGWTGTVYLLARHLHRWEPITEAGLDNAVMFVHEVFSKEYFANYSERVQAALLRLSLLDEFSMQLVVDLTDMKADDLLELAGANIMIHGRTTAGGVNYFFDYLYQLYLENTRVLVPQEEQLSFYQKAARWYAKQGICEQAIKYFVASSEYDSLLPLLRNTPIVQMQPEQIQNICSLLTSIPPGYVEQHPEHQLYRILLQSFAGQTEQVKKNCESLKKFLEQKERSLHEDRILGEIYLMISLYSWYANTDISLEYLKRASELLPEGSSCMDRDTVLTLGKDCRINPGALSKITEIFDKCIPYAKILFPEGGVGRYHLTAAEANLLQNQLEEASLQADKAILEAGLHNNTMILCEANYLQLRISMANGELDDLLYYCEQIKIHESKLKSPVKDSVTVVAECHFHRFLGLYHQMEEHIKKDPLTDPSYTAGMGYGKAAFQHALYLILIAKQYRSALSYIDTIIPLCRKNGLWVHELDMMILKSVIYQLMDKKKFAVEFLIRAYQMSAGNDVVFPFVEYGNFLVKLIDDFRGDISEAEIPRVWIDRVWRLAEDYEERRKRLRMEYLNRYQQSAVNLLEQLSQKEYRTLELLCREHSLEEIADRMGVKKETVYSYLYRVYAKLDVKDKEEAILLAKREGILSEGE